MHGKRCNRTAAAAAAAMPWEMLLLLPLLCLL
jgi:hypothetical protein